MRAFVRQPGSRQCCVKRLIAALYMVNALEQDHSLTLGLQSSCSRPPKRLVTEYRSKNESSASDFVTIVESNDELQAHETSSSIVKHESNCQFSISFALWCSLDWVLNRRCRRHTELGEPYACDTKTIMKHDV